MLRDMTVSMRVGGRPRISTRCGYSKGKGGAGGAARRTPRLSSEATFPGKTAQSSLCSKASAPVAGRRRCVAAHGTCVFRRGDRREQLEPEGKSGECEGSGYDCSTGRRSRTTSRTVRSSATAGLLAAFD